jgi:GT2 family glycosyltransferase
LDVKMDNYTSIVIPTIGKDNMILSLIDRIKDINDTCVKDIFIFDNGMPNDTLQACQSYNVRVIHSHGKNIYSMWNDGVSYALLNNSKSICIFNDDLNIPLINDWFKKLIRPLSEDDVWAVSANYNPFIHNDDTEFKEVIGTFKDGGFAGFCFAVKLDAYIKGLPLFDDTYNWWFGDDDFVHSVHKAGKKTVISLNAIVEHIHGGSRSVHQYTPEFNTMVEKDKQHYFRKWHS